MATKLYYVQPGYDWIVGRRTPENRLIELTDDEAEYDLEQSRIILNGFQPPGDPNPDIDVNDVLTMRRNGISRTFTISDLVAYLGGSVGPAPSLSLSSLTFHSGVPSGAVLAAIAAPAGWAVTAETTFGGRVAVDGLNLVAAASLTGAAAGTVRLRATSPDSLRSITQTFSLVMTDSGSSPQPPTGFAYVLNSQGGYVLNSAGGRVLVEAV